MRMLLRPTCSLQHLDLTRAWKKKKRKKKKELKCFPGRISTPTALPVSLVPEKLVAVST